MYIHCDQIKNVHAQWSLSYFDSRNITEQNVLFPNTLRDTDE